MICAETSLYPLKTNDATSIIDNSIMTLKQSNIEYNVGSISTHIHGDEDEVWKGLKALFDEAQRGGEVNMVVTISNAVH
ncbi:MAG: YkoF family thiamine/hydroxymethylpyrimidine-binding protein [Clostridia bacterium]|nr:YkoF family thiamine/hydroxymethylpyrimidine-binding protein [Clostridia bacterium]